MEIEHSGAPIALVYLTDCPAAEAIRKHAEKAPSPGSEAAIAQQCSGDWYLDEITALNRVEGEPGGFAPAIMIVDNRGHAG